MRNIPTAIALALVVAGCSLTLPVRGELLNSDERFSGSATGYRDGSGVLKVTSTTGTVCTGKFVYETSRKGAGTFQCTDGRTGPFQFVSTGRSGNGWGEFGDNRKFTFTFGN